MKLNTKVLIIGGGPAGATAAAVLAQNGADCLLLEKNRSRTKPCGGGLGLQVFEEFHIPKAPIKKTVTQLGIISPLGERVNLNLTDHPLAIVDRQIFDETLRQKAQDQGASIIEGEFLQVLKSTKCLVEALVEKEKVEITSEFLIAADGVNSRVRASLSLQSPKVLYTISERLSAPGWDCCEFWFGASHAPKTYSWVFPAAEGLSVGTQTFDPRKLNSLFQAFKSRVDLPAQGVKKVYPIPVWDGKLYQIKNILFVGDAAGQVMPLSYEGIYYAMKSGELAAQAILEGKSGLYKKMWKSRFQKRFLMMKQLEHFFLRNDVWAEKMVRLHTIPEVQKASLLIWLGKDNRKHGLLHYVKLFGKYLTQDRRP
jgi:geranylgeranyl reductase